MVVKGLGGSAAEKTLQGGLEAEAAAAAALALQAHRAVAHQPDGGGELRVREHVGGAGDVVRVGAADGESARTTYETCQDFVKPVAACGNATSARVET